MNRFERCVWVAAVMLIGCGGGGATPEPARESAESAGGEQVPASQKAPAVDIAALLAQESEALPLHDVKAPDGSVKTRVEASAPPSVEAGDGYVQLTAPFAGHELQCFVYPEAKDGAELLRIMVEGTLVKAAPEHSWVDVHGDQSAGWPYVIGRAHYLVDGPNGKLVGDFKIAVSVRGETSVMCVLDAPGHYASFERALRGLLADLDSAANHGLPSPERAEITRTHLPGRMVSVDSTLIFKDGAATVEKSSSMDLTIGQGGTLITSDDAANKVFRDGRLESASYANASMGELEYSMQLSTRKRSYHVEGTVQDKPVKGEFEVKGGIPDRKREGVLACAVRDGKQPRAELLDYVPKADPLAPSQMAMVKSPQPGADLQITLGGAEGVQLLVSVDDTCQPEKGSMKVGAVALEIARLWQERGKR